jgi:hypothetical protein
MRFVIGSPVSRRKLLGKFPQRHAETIRCARLSVRFHSRHHLLTQAKPLPETLAGVTSTRGGAGLSACVSDQFFDEL